MKIFLITYYKIIDVLEYLFRQKLTYFNDNLFGNVITYMENSIFLNKAIYFVSLLVTEIRGKTMFFVKYFPRQHTPYFVCQK